MSHRTHAYRGGIIMQRGKWSLTSVLMSVLLILTSSAYAPLGALSGSTAGNDATSLEAVDDYGVLDIVFDGHYLSWLAVKNIAPDPVITWGVVRDASENPIDGEVWLIVAKTDKFIYFQLTEEPNTNQDATAYGGYTVKLKATMTLQFYNFGGGSAVPVIGTATDAFLVTTKMMINSAFTDGEQQQLSISTGTARDYLVHLYDVVQASSVRLGGGGRDMAIQLLAPDGTEIAEPFTISTSDDASSAADCQAMGDSAASAINTWVSGGQVAMWYADLIAAATAGASAGLMVGAGVANPVISALGIVALPAISGLGTCQQELHQAMLNTAKQGGLPHTPRWRKAYAMRCRPPPRTSSRR
jgi:hypothetical protein